MSKLLIKPAPGYYSPKADGSNPFSETTGSYPNTLVEAIYWDKEQISLEEALRRIQEAIDSGGGGTVELVSDFNDSFNDSFGGSSKYELRANKVNAINSSSTNTQYPSAKAVYDALQNAGGGCSCYTEIHLPDSIADSTEHSDYGDTLYWNFIDSQEVSDATGVPKTTIDKILNGELYTDLALVGDLGQRSILRCYYSEVHNDYGFYSKTEWVLQLIDGGVIGSKKLSLVSSSSGDFGPYLVLSFGSYIEHHAISEPEDTL